MWVSRRSGNFHISEQKVFPPLVMWNYVVVWWSTYSGFEFFVFGFFFFSLSFRFYPSTMDWLQTQNPRFYSNVPRVSHLVTKWKSRKHGQDWKKTILRVSKTDPFWYKHFFHIIKGYYNNHLVNALAWNYFSFREKDNKNKISKIKNIRVNKWMEICLPRQST